jgi:hypothetical protein
MKIAENHIGKQSQIKEIKDLFKTKLIFYQSKITFLKLNPKSYLKIEEFHNWSSPKVDKIPNGLTKLE